MIEYEDLLYNPAPKTEGKLQLLLDLEFGDNFPLTNVSEITCVTRSLSTRQTVHTFKKSEDTITVTGQALQIPLQPEDTRGKADDYQYECDFMDAQNRCFFTIRGKFRIIAEINKS